jgi:hypothetical protein
MQATLWSRRYNPEMGIYSVLSALGLAFAAFSVWLTVRIIARRERWAKRTATALVVMILPGYPLSAGPLQLCFNVVPDSWVAACLEFWNVSANRHPENGHTLRRAD